MSEFIIDMGNSSYKSSSGLLCADVSQLREEIVRCRDCKHYNTKLTDEYDGTSWCCIHAGYAFPDDYCSWAERREQ